VQEYKILLVISNESYVAKYFSQAIIEDELDSISKAISKSELEEENLEVRLNKSTREIITRYQVDEGEKNEMIIRLPPSYPLAEVEIDGKSRVGVTAERWNKWLLTCKIACKV
jgi:E3 ubiquitin-protein ligase listerin